MSDGTSEAIEQYRRLREQVDRQSGRLVDMHCKHVACRPGCHDCCTSLTVSPVEYHAILDDLRRAEVTSDTLPFNPDAACPYLNGGLCGLYRFRPLICRTHGLPIAFLNDDESPPQVNVSFCPKNFSEAGPEELDFGPENTLDLDELNAELAEANLHFLTGAPVNAPDPTPRISLARLKEDLARPAD